MILITHGEVATRDENNTFIHDGAVAIEGTKIKEAGASREMESKYPDAQVIDAKGRLTMPGFINTHMHYYSTFARGMTLDSKPPVMLSDILKGLWWRLDKALTLEDVYYSAIGPMIEEIRCGVTTVVDHHASPHAVSGSLFAIAGAAGRAGVRSNLCYEVSDRDGSDIAWAGIRENTDFLRHCAQKDDDMLRGLFGLHAQMTLSDATLEKCVQAAADTGAGFHIHAAEGIEDVADSLSKHDMRVIERLNRFGVLTEKSIAAHCIHITPQEMEMLAESGVAVVHNPQSNMGNAVGVSPVLEMMARGVPVGLGTDGYTADMTESYKAAGILQKHAKGLPSVAWEEPPRMLFENNRAIVNRHLTGLVGALAPGWLADVIIADYWAPTPLNENTVNAHILFGVSGRHVDTTIVNGKIRMLHRELTDIDAGGIAAKSRELSARLWERV